MANLPPKDSYKFCPRCASKMQKKDVDGETVDSCPLCNFIFWGNPKPVVSLLIGKDGKILMLQRTKEPFREYWVLPGGFIRWEERPEEAVRRETKEEIGLDASVTGLIGVYHIDNDPRGVHIDIIYEGEADGEIRLNPAEHQGFKFFSVSQLPEKIAYKHREAIKDWASRIK